MTISLGQDVQSDRMDRVSEDTLVFLAPCIAFERIDRQRRDELCTEIGYRIKGSENSRNGKSDFFGSIGKRNRAAQTVEDKTGESVGPSVISR